MLGTLPTLPYPERTSPRHTPLNPTPTPAPYTYSTLPTPNPYLTPVLPYTALPCPTIHYPTFPLYMKVRSDVSVVLLSTSVSESGLVLSFLFGPLKSSNRYRPDELGQVRR